MTSADGPLAATEMAFLDSIRQHVRKVFFIVNKTDLLADAERVDVLRFIGESLARRMNLVDVPLFPISSRMALLAKVESDTVQLETERASGLGGGVGGLSDGSANCGVPGCDPGSCRGTLAGEQEQDAVERRTAIHRLRDRVLSGAG